MKGGEELGVGIKPDERGHFRPGRLARLPAIMLVSMKGPGAQTEGR